MVPRIILERVSALGGELVLSRRGNEYSIRVAGCELMNSLDHGSEDELGRMTCAAMTAGGKPRVLVGGLGLGYTLRATLDALPHTARLEVAEIVPAVVRWNRTLLGELAGFPLLDPRVTVIEDDVANVISRGAGCYDAIVLDVDNGPDGIAKSNDALYRRRGLAAALAALRPGGVFTVWSSFQSPTFTRWLHDVGFEMVDVAMIRSKYRGGPRHYIWLGRRPADAIQGKPRPRSKPRR